MNIEMKKYWIWPILWISLLQRCALGLGQYSDNTPPVLRLERTWKIDDTEPIGATITRVIVDDNKNGSLEFGIERNGGQSDDKPLPFKIDKKTGVVHTNESLINRGGEQFFLYVTVFDGKYPVKTEILVQIRNTSVPSTFPATEGMPLAGFISRLESKPKPQLLFPPGITQQSDDSRHPQLYEETSTISSITKLMFTSPSTPTLNIAGNKHNLSTNVTLAPKDGTIASVSDLTRTIIPVAIVCGLFFVAAGLFVLCRHKLCRNRTKNNKDDMGKEPSGGIVLEEPMAMQHWRGPRAHSNRYEGWDRDGASQAPRLATGKAADSWEFPRHRLKVYNIVGEGCFGQVWRCEAVDIDGYEGTTVVAVKTLKENASEKERSDLVQELQVMKMLEPHTNVVRLLGCCTDKDPLFVIMEFVAHGKLQSYLRSSRAGRYYGNLHGPSDSLTSRDLTSFVYQVARGMDYLSSKGIVHRDLAARNVLVGEGQICKVADFGFARDVVSSHVYERKSEDRLPIRWMAPESLYDNIFSVKSDVWSFGVLIWEVVTLGSTPYPGLAAADVMRRVRDGYRLDKPEHCRRELYNIMYYCWDKDAKERPSFHELVRLLEQLLLTETEYIELERFPDHCYYNMVSLSGEKL